MEKKSIRSITSGTYCLSSLDLMVTPINTKALLLQENFRTGLLIHFPFIKKDLFRKPLPCMLTGSLRIPDNYHSFIFSSISYSGHTFLKNDFTQVISN